jgi:hypothetical protein
VFSGVRNWGVGGEQADISAVVPGVQWCAVQLGGGGEQDDISAVVPGVQWCAVQICASTGLQCSGVNVL